MQAHIVSPSNAILASHFLLNLDISTIRKSYQPIVRDEVVTMKQSLAALKKAYQTKHLSTLTTCVNDLVNALSDEARERLTYFITLNQTL